MIIMVYSARGVSGQRQKLYGDVRFGSVCEAEIEFLVFQDMT